MKKDKNLEQEVQQEEVSQREGHQEIRIKCLRMAAEYNLRYRGFRYEGNCLAFSRKSLFYPE